MKKTNPIPKQVRHLFYNRSLSKSIILTISILLLYFFSSFGISKIYYTITKIYSYVYIPRQYFFIFYYITTLPVFVFIFLKLNIWTNFWRDVKKPHVIDYIFFGTIILFCYFSFNCFVDLPPTAIHGNQLLDMILRGNSILDFYKYNQSSASYLLPQYILFAIWSIPVKIGYLLTGLPPLDITDYNHITGLTLWWYKLLPTVFYMASAFVIYKIALTLGYDKHKAEWVSFTWIISPLGVFSQFIFGQYDSIGIFFELLMIHCFLQKKILRATLFCMFGITFKFFPLFIFIPILLLFEKKVLKIIGFTLLVFTAYLFFSLPYSSIENNSHFNNIMLNRLFAVGIHTSFGTISLFIIVFIFVCTVAFFTKTDKQDNFIIQKTILYIPLVIYSFFFSFVHWHSQWILLLTPYLILNIFLNTNGKSLIFIAIAVSVGFLFTAFCSPMWLQLVDASMINMGIFPKIFGFFHIVDTDTLFPGMFLEPYDFFIATDGDFKSLSMLLSFGGKMPVALFFSLFVAMLLANLIISFPNKKNIESSRSSIKGPFTIQRDVLWIYGLIVLLITTPSLLLFFSHGTKWDNRIISTLQIPKDIEILRQGTYNIESLEIKDDNLVLNCGNIDPQFHISLQDTPSLLSSERSVPGMPFVEITYTNSKSGQLQVFCDYGKGFDEKTSGRRSITAIHEATVLHLPIRGWEKENMIGIRLDPPEGSKFMLISIKIGFAKLLN